MFITVIFAIVIVVAVIVGGCTIGKSRRAIEIPDGTTVTEYTGKLVSLFDIPQEMQAIIRLFDDAVATCVKGYSMSIDRRYRNKNHLHTYSKDGLLMESFVTCSLNDSTDEIEKEIQIFITKDEYLCVFTIKDNEANRRVIRKM